MGPESFDEMEGLPEGTPPPQTPEEQIEKAKEIIERLTGEEGSQKTPEGEGEKQEEPETEPRPSLGGKRGVFPQVILGPPEKPKPPSRAKKIAGAVEAGVKGVGIAIRETADELDARVRKEKQEREKRREEKRLEKELRKIEKRKGKEAAEEARKIKKGEAMKMKGTKIEKPEKVKEKQKTWEEMTEEERRERYGRTFELRERLKNFENQRANLVVLENELNKMRSPFMRTAVKVLFRKKEREGRMSLKDLEKKYQEALERYKLTRAEYIGAKTWRMLKEGQRLAETEATKYVEASAFETMRRGWRWLGEQNAEKLLAKFGRKPQNRFLKFTARMVSLRTVASLGLLGGGMALGFGSAVGIGALAARRVMGGAGTAFGSYDLMKMVTEKRALALNEKKVAGMTNVEIEEKITEFEARAKFSGERIVRSKEYLFLRREYKTRIEEGWMGAPESKSTRIANVLQSLDTVLREKGGRITKEEKHRKVAAIGIGLFSIGAFSASDIAKAMEGKPEFADITPEEVREAVQKGSVVTPKQLQDSVNVERTLPDTVVGRVASDTTQTTMETPETAGVVPAPEQAENYVATIRKDEGIWQALRRMVTDKTITEEQMRDALKNPASTATLSSGNPIHVTELHLVHEGDQVVYVPGEGGGPGHVEVQDFAGDSYRLGDARDLADAMKQEGHWGHKAHGWLYDKLKEYPPGYRPAGAAELAPLPQIPEETLRQIQEEIAKIPPPEAALSPQEAVQGAANEALEVAQQEITFEGGTARWILDNHGRIADVLIQETTSSEKRAGLINQAVQEFLQPNFQRALERGVPDETKHLIMPDRIARAHDAAWEVFRLRRILDTFSDRYSSESYFLRYKIQVTAKARELMLGARIFKAFRF